ncbi:hypothetical protein ABZ863_25310 [Saccharomonospora sp. NPDC046836]|uniref:hypothetical protein n=1 Tax=Saccharomonospora sp. NPDC046836 TaxID=3156921 RepID=UPI0033DBA358
MKNFYAQIGIAGTSLSRTPDAVVRPGDDLFWTDKPRFGGCTPARDARAFATTEAGIGTREFRPMTVQLPLKDKPWVPLCPSERRL